MGGALPGAVLPGAPRHRGCAYLIRAGRALAYFKIFEPSARAKGASAPLACKREPFI